MSVPPTGRRVYAAPHDIAWVDAGEHEPSGALYLARMPRGDTVVLSGSARFIWLVAARGSTNVPDDVGHLVGVPAHDIEDDVREFLEELTDQRLLVAHLVT